RPRAARASADRLEHDRPRGRRLVAELVGGQDLRGGLRGRSVVPGMDLAERLARGDLVAPLLEAANADGVVDAVVLRAPPGAQAQRRHTDGDRTYRADVPGLRGRHLADDGRTRQGVLGRVAALRRDPALVQRE